MSSYPLSLSRFRLSRHGPSRQRLIAPRSVHGEHVLLVLWQRLHAAVPHVGRMLELYRRSNLVPSATVKLRLLDLELGLCQLGLEGLPFDFLIQLLRELLELVGQLL